jgi:NitT/TauT family transport system permease protein
MGWINTARLEKVLRADSTPRVRRRDARVVRLAWAALSALVFIGIWEIVIRLGDYPAYILPSPSRVFASAMALLRDGTLWRHTQTTLIEVLVGLALGLAVASVLGYTLAKSRTVERLLAPYIVASQAIPVVALAPLLVIWFGPGMVTKVLVAALIVFFPVLINVIVGVRSVEPDLRDLMRSLEATRWQTFTKLEVPAALPVLLGGLKIGATLSVIGAVVGEFLGTSAGLGYLINEGRGLYDTPKMFVGLFGLVTLALILYGAAAWLERRALAWRESNGH